MADLRDKIGWALYEMRDEVGLSQADVAERMGIAQRTYANLEAGDQRIYLDQLLAAEDACNRPYGYVLRRAELLTDAADVRAALNADTNLTDSWRSVIHAAYESAVRQSASTRAASRNRSAKKSKTRRS